MRRSRSTLLAIALVIGFILVLIAVFRSCREGTVTPDERDRLDETSYMVLLNSDIRDADARTAAAGGMQLRTIV